MANEAEPGEGKVRELRLPTVVNEVVLMEDRAQVTRTGTLTLPAGRVRLLVENVSPVLADKTLAARVVSGPEGVQVTNLTVRRSLRRREEKRPEAVAEIEAKLRETETDLRIVQEEARILQQEFEGLAEAAQQHLEDVSVDVSWGRAEPESWQTQFRRLTEWERRLRDDRLGLNIRAADLGEKRDDLSFQHNALLSPSADWGAVIEAEVTVPAGGDCDFAFLYVVPGACWRPQHTAHLESTDKGPVLHFETDACVWQNTGESWQDAQLHFSTQRPSLGTDPPLMAADFLYTQDKEEQVVVEARDQKIETTGLGPGAQREVPEVPGIDDAGEALVMRSKDRATVPSDGRPYRIPVSAFESKATSEYVAFPERACAVLHKCSATNGGSRPILAGPVDLVARSGFVGRTSVLFIAPGEQFELGFGPDPEIRIHRRVEEVPHEKGMLSRWVKTDMTVTLNLSNIGATEKVFQLTERIPVSEVEQVRIVFDGDESSPGAKPDENGFVAWEVQISPGGTAEKKLHYRIEKHHDVAGI
ncbi:MAG: mucoidy inhibitor MuiA family protein [Planctomycetota bacterium]|jgi:uncharacterized protein (TIGR02231 family)